MNEEASPRAGTPILIGIGIVVLIALLITVALARGDVRTYEPGTPEATAQAFIQALFDEDTETAHSYLSPGLQVRCEPEDFDTWWVNSADSASFDETRVDGDHAEIEVRLMSNDYEFGILPFDNYDYSRETELELGLLNGEWVITNATWPLAGCTWR